MRASSDESVSEVHKARTIAHGNTLIVALPSASPQLPSNWVCLQAFIDAHVHKTSHHQDATIAVWSTILKLAHRWQFTKSRPLSRTNLCAHVPEQRRNEEDGVHYTSGQQDRDSEMEGVAPACAHGTSMQPIARAYTEMYPQVVGLVVVESKSGSSAEANVRIETSALELKVRRRFVSTTVIHAPARVLNVASNPRTSSVHSANCKSGGVKSKLELEDSRGKSIEGEKLKEFQLHVTRARAWKINSRCHDGGKNQGRQKEDRGCCSACEVPGSADSHVIESVQGMSTCPPNLTVSPSKTQAGMGDCKAEEGLPLPGLVSHANGDAKCLPMPEVYTTAWMGMQEGGDDMAAGAGAPAVFAAHSRMNAQTVFQARRIRDLEWIPGTPEDSKAQIFALRITVDAHPSTMHARILLPPTLNCSRTNSNVNERHIARRRSRLLANVVSAAQHAYQYCVRVDQEVGQNNGK
ncbi:hypothetical protein DFH08DRAFT_800399 [Mycena albidolilacea]|uniref:Uncharacterized protein n=1 Tax=Mycena albidolilacea TaxID=1033008 RepID=A0AAD7AJQ9_9AGAR|nr:hypothetical protein DFH08DRAFT_800399 [Mycena albidolilacea]